MVHPKCGQWPQAGGRGIGATVQRRRRRGLDLF